jgi:hypothetical protein
MMTQDFRKLLESCPVAYKKKGTGQNSRLPARGKRYDPQLGQ